MDTENPIAEASRPVEASRVHRRLWRAETIYAVGLMLFALLAALAHVYAYFVWDLVLSRDLQSVGGIYPLMRGVSYLGDKWYPWALSAVTFLAFLIAQKRAEAWGFLFCVGGGKLANSLIKVLIARPRPAANLVTIMQVERTLSFPSGHVTFFVCYFGFLFFVAYALLPRGSFAGRASMTLCVILVVLIGFSRVYLGAHWPSDTLGAYLFSGMWVALSLNLYRRWKKA
jgi:membrane-associated phospholipid phosphatase